MNRLALCQMVRQMAGIAGSGPTTTIGQTGELKRVVDWVDGAWAEIQQAHRWDFLWEATTIGVSANANVVPGSIPAHRYVKDSVYNGTARLDYLAWALFRVQYPQIADGTPTVWTIRPDKAFVVSAKPADAMTLSVERYKNPLAMTADADEPGLPSEHHMAIVYKALLLYANFEEAGVTRATALAEFNRHMGALGVLELPDAYFGEPLAC